MAADGVLVTGAGGFIGRNVTEELIGRSFEVRVTDLPGTDLSYAAELGAEVVTGDLMDYEFAGEVVDGVGRVVHLAAAFDLGLPREVLLRTNLTTTDNMARASARAGIELFVQYSTCDVFGLKRKGPVSEDDPKKPQCAYSLSKLMSEFTAMSYMKKSGLPVAVVRPTFVYGPGALYTARSFIVLPALLSRYADSVPLPAGGPRTNTIHVKDMATATAVVLEAGRDAAGLSYNVADDGELEAFDFLREIFAPFGVRCSRKMELPWAAVEVAGRLAGLVPKKGFELVNEFLCRRWDPVLASERLRPLLYPHIDKDFLGFLYGEHLYSNERMKSLGWEPNYRTFADGWPQTVEWYRSRSLIP